MDQLLSQTITILLGGGTQAVVAVLVMAVIGLLADRRRMMAEIRAKDARAERRIDDYYKANIQVSEALASIKQLIELRLK